MSFRISWEDKGAYCQFFGDCTVSDILDVLEQLGVHPRFTGFHYAIHDFLAVSRHRLTPHDMEIVAAMDYAIRLSNRRIHVACVAVPAIAPLWRSYARRMASPERSALFPELQQARGWIAQADRYAARSNARQAGMRF
jgi:hypothetical protein